jgi:predicted nucleotidyltransferase
MMAIRAVNATLLTSLRGIFSRYSVALAYLYGSQAVGRATPLSDFDVALVMVDEDYDPKSRLNLELQVEGEIARICGISDIDVRIMNDAPIMVRGEVVTNGSLLYCQDEIFRVDYETSTRSQYFDFIPTAVMHREAYFEQLRDRGKNG